MAKITPLNDLTSLANEASVVSTINTNNQRIEDALDNTLSLDGSTPNTLAADLDMNSKRIMNLPAAVNPSEPLTLQQAEASFAFDSLAAEYAENAEDVAITGNPGQFSAKHHSLKASASAARLYANTTAGLAGTSDTEYFKVPEAGGDRLYYNNAGVAEDQGIVYPTKAAVDQAVTDAQAEVVLAEAAETAAELARDIAAASANLYTSTAAAEADGGLANGSNYIAPLATGSFVFQAYTKDSGASSTAFGDPFVPSKTGISAMVDASANDMRVTTDYLTDATWGVGTISELGAVITSGYEHYSLSDFIAVAPEATVIRMVCGNNVNTARPNILGFDDAQNVTSTILANGAVNATALSPAVVTIPAGTAYIRICSPTASLLEAKQCSIEEIATANIFDEYLDPDSGNFLGEGLPYAKADGSVGTVGEAYGTGYVPVVSGDVIRYRLKALGTLAAVNAYDSGQTYIKTIAGTLTRDDSYEYTFNGVDDPGVAYVVASDYLNDGTGFFTLESAKNQLTLNKERAEGAVCNNLYGLGVASYYSFGGPGSLSIVNDGKYDVVTFTTNPVYLHVRPSQPRFTPYLYGFVAMKMRLDSLPSGTEATLDWYNNPVHLNSGPQVFEVGDEFVLWAEFDPAKNIHIICDVDGAEFSVIDSKSCRIHNDFRATLEDKHKTEIMSDPLFFSDEYGVTDYARRSVYADFTNTQLKDGHLVVFGDSVMKDSGIPEDVANRLQMDVTNLAISGEEMPDILDDGQLAAIPTDATLVVITGGYNGLTSDGTLTSRVRTTKYGCLNYAIDWIYANRTGCRILLATLASSTAGTIDWSPVYRAVAAARLVPLADIELDADINPDNVADLTAPGGIHPNAEGAKRQAGVIYGKLRSIVY